MTLVVKNAAPQTSITVAHNPDGSCVFYFGTGFTLSPEDSVALGTYLLEAQPDPVEPEQPAEPSAPVEEPAPTEPTPEQPEVPVEEPVIDPAPTEPQPVEPQAPPVESQPEEPVDAQFPAWNPDHVSDIEDPVDSEPIPSAPVDGSADAALASPPLDGSPDPTPSN